MASARRPSSLRRRLLSWILLPLLGLIAINAYVGYGNAVQAANDAYDRSLYLAARTLAEELEWRDGRLQIDVLRAAGYLFENHTGSRLFYKVTTAQGQLLAGDAALPDPPARQEVSVQYFALVQFDDGAYRQQPVRLAQLTHVLEGAGMADPLVRIVVAETMEARQQLIQHILRGTLGSQGLLLLLAAVLVVWGVQRGIRPLEPFRLQLANKADDDFAPIHPPDLPRELQPLIETLNGYLARLGRLIEIRKRFLDNVAHQLRTPLTALKTQLTLAQRNPEPAQAQALLQAAHRTTDDAVRLTEQLLAMTRAEHAHELHTAQIVELVALARQVTQEHLLRAHTRGEDLGLEALVERCEVHGIALLLHEAISNLIDNAIHHGEAGCSRITVRVGQGWVEVEDNGPGIAEKHQPHVFERFYRAAPAGLPGSGLGLAIVREIALQHGARVSIRSPLLDGRGTAVRIAWDDAPVSG